LECLNALWYAHILDTGTVQLYANISRMYLDFSQYHNVTFVLIIALVRLMHMHMFDASMTNQG